MCARLVSGPCLFYIHTPAIKWRRARIKLKINSAWDGCGELSERQVGNYSSSPTQIGIESRHRAMPKCKLDSYQLKLLVCTIQNELSPAFQSVSSCLFFLGFVVFLFKTTRRLSDILKTNVSNWAAKLELPRVNHLAIYNRERLVRSKTFPLRKQSGICKSFPIDRKTWATIIRSQSGVSLLSGCLYKSQ